MQLSPLHFSAVLRSILALSRLTRKALIVTLFGGRKVTLSRLVVVLSPLIMYSKLLALCRLAIMVLARLTFISFALVLWRFHHHPTQHGHQQARLLMVSTATTTTTPMAAN